MTLRVCDCSHGLTGGQAFQAGKQPFYVYAEEEDGFLFVQRWNCVFTCYDSEKDVPYEALFASASYNQGARAEGYLYQTNSENGYPTLDL